MREPAEYEIVRIPGSMLMPKGDILSGEALGELPQDRQIVLHCKSGIRSAPRHSPRSRWQASPTPCMSTVASLLAEQIDPSLPATSTPAPTVLPWVPDSLTEQGM